MIHDFNKSPLTRGEDSLSKWPKKFMAEIHGGDPNYLLNGMIPPSIPKNSLNVKRISLGDMSHLQPFCIIHSENATFAPQVLFLEVSNRENRHES